MERIAALGSPLVADTSQVSPLEPLQQGDQMFTTTRQHYKLATRNLAALTPPDAATLISATEHRTSPLRVINLHHFHVAATLAPIAVLVRPGRASPPPGG